MCDVPVADGDRRVPRRTRRRRTSGTSRRRRGSSPICAVLLELKVGRLMPRHDRADEEDLLGGVARPRVRPLAGARRLPAAWRSSSRDAWRIEAGYFARDVGPGPEFSHLYPDVDARP